MTPALQLRSYRLAFELERRIFRIDRYRLPVPYGLPLTAVAWWFAALVAVVLAARVPLLGGLLGVVPWPARLIVVPAALARAACASGPDRRPAYERAAARARRVAGPRRVAAFGRSRSDGVVRLGDVCVAGDERSSVLRPAVIRGAGEVLVARAARGRTHGHRIELWSGEERWLQTPGRMDLEAGSRLEVKCAPR